VYQISPHSRGLYNPELESEGASTWLAMVINKKGMLEKNISLQLVRNKMECAKHAIRKHRRPG
jgi:hypothetical protein